MKATGEGMAMDTTFEGAFMKALSSMNMKLKDEVLSLENIYKNLKTPTSDRILWVIKVLEKDVSVEKIVELTKITPWFIQKLRNITEIKKAIKEIGQEILKEKITNSPMKKVLSNKKNSSLFRKAKALMEGNNNLLIHKSVSI